MPYVSLENPDTRLFATNDPRGFLSTYPQGAILDEVQRVPELFSYLQQTLDETNKTGLFILTGSNNFSLQEGISQSLAGRIGYLTLLPLTVSELDHLSPESLEATLFKGFYPPLYNQPIEPCLWFANYIRTYIERDVRQLRNISNLQLFERFVRLCAGRIGQLLNVNSLALECGIDQKTASGWLSILESSYLIFRLPPYHQNFNKRLTKMTKLYFHDVGLACALLGIQELSQLTHHPLKEALFENLCISEVMKIRQNKLQDKGMYFWRTHVGHEIDLLIEQAHDLLAIEIKSGQTLKSEAFKGLEFWNQLTGSMGGLLVYSGSETQKRSSGISVTPWQQLDSYL